MTTETKPDVATRRPTEFKVALDARLPAGPLERLRAALREDPDAILVGEMRDLETIRLALTAAETGHLVFGTLHTSSAAKTIDRIIDVFPAEPACPTPWSGSPIRPILPHIPPHRNRLPPKRHTWVPLPTAQRPGGTARRGLAWARPGWFPSKQTDQRR